MDGLRGATRLAIEATRGVTDLVEAMHLGIGAGPAVLGRPLDLPTRLLTWPVYGAIRGVTRTVGAGLDAALGRLAPLLAPGPANGEPATGEPGNGRAALLAALNGVLGDHLAATGNPLAIEMRMLHRGVPLEPERGALLRAVPEAGARLLVLVHGSCLDERHWGRQGQDHAAALARDLGFTPVHLRYNTGLHVSTNGHALASLLERIASAWPVPVEEVVLLGHSMGGLVARSACHSGEVAGHAWRGRLSALVCLGSPHQGAPLERAGHLVHVLLGVSRYSAPLARLGRIRSAGVTDLRFGNVRDSDWRGRDRFGSARDARAPLSLPQGVACYAVAASTAAAPGPGGRLPGDGLVPVDSALGRHASRERTLAFPEANQWIALGMGHLDLLGRPEVYARIRSWLAA